MYDSYGVLENIPWPVINKGDMVEYITADYKIEGKRTITFKRSLVGQWDGEKVEFNDPQQHVVRTTRWLRKV